MKNANRTKLSIRPFPGPLRTHQYKGLVIASFGRGSTYRIALPNNGGLYGDYKRLSDAKKAIRGWNIDRQQASVFKETRLAQVAEELAALRAA